MFILDPGKEIVGYSFWPWDSVYTPVVGCFRDGRLVETAACDLLPQAGLKGPEHAWWFRMRVDPAIAASLERGDSSVRIMRLEDGALLEPAFAVETPPPAMLRVEELVAHASAAPLVELNGFTAFLKAPPAHQLAVLYLDVLGRGVDSHGLRGYLPRLQAGMSILQIRAEVMRADEFRHREVTVSSRVGSLLTSPLWTELLHAEPLGEATSALPEIRVADYRELDDAAFVRALHRDCFGRDADDGTAAWLTEGIGNGRDWVASVLVRDAARGNLFLDLAAH